MSDAGLLSQVAVNVEQLMKDILEQLPGAMRVGEGQSTTPGCRGQAQMSQLASLAARRLVMSRRLVTEPS